MIRIRNGIKLDEKELQYQYVRSRGPGGQHVNKASTAVQLRFDVVGSSSISEPVKRRLRRIAKSHMTGDGEILIFADRYRSQRRNRDDAVQRLVALIEEAARPPRRRVKTRPSQSSIERRLQKKRRRGLLKKSRRWRPGDDD
jgi:ribosome-associated protein